MTCTRIFITFICITMALSSCRSVVPEPSKALESNAPTAKYKMQNIAPLKASGVYALHFVDLNQDGNLDILVGGNQNTDSFNVEWGNSTGNWETQSGPSTAMQPLSFSTADINHNQNIDILIGGHGDQKGLQIWEYQNHTKTWHLQSSPLSTGTFSAVYFIDINHDGWHDIIAARDGGGIALLLNNGRGQWIQGNSPVIRGVFTGIAIEDINGDGNVDIIASRRGGLGAQEDDDEIWKQVGGIQIWYGDGNGRWKPEELPAESDAESVTVSDINGDGSLDIIAGLYQQGITIWWNHNGSWRQEQLISEGTWSDIKVGDLNADGKRELIASSSVGQGLHIWHWQGRSFQKDTTLTPNFGTYLDIDLGDIRNDGTLAIAATRADSGIEIWSSKKAGPLPTLDFLGTKIGNHIPVPFEIKGTKINKSNQKALKEKLLKLTKTNPSIHFEVTGFPDQKPTHSDLFPNDMSLSLARAESMVNWLKSNGYNDVNITPLPHATKMHGKVEADRLKNYSEVHIQPFVSESSRLPLSASNLKQPNLFEITENSVFKTLDGIAEYKVGPGDELNITFWQGSKADIKKVIVQIDGTISLPYQAALNVANQTPREIDSLITNILKRYERKPRVDIRLVKAQSKHVSIFGEINSLSRQPTGPGTYNLGGKENLVDFLSRVGGPTKDANLNTVQVIRDGKTIVLNLNRAVQQGDTSENAIIDDGDTIFVPSLAQSKRQVYVLGEVNKVGIVEFSDDINFLDAISQSGGLTPDAYLADIRVLRANRAQPEILAVDFERFMEKGDLTQNLALIDKDIIIIPSRPIANWNKYITDISPTITLLLQPVSIAQQILTLKVLSGQIQ